MPWLPSSEKSTRPRFAEPARSHHAKALRTPLKLFFFSRVSLPVSPPSALQQSRLAKQLAMDEESRRQALDAEARYLELALRNYRRCLQASPRRGVRVWA